MLLIAVIALLLWIAAGVGLFHWYARPRGSAITRAVDRALMPVGQSVGVTLRMIPPSSPAMTAEPHDVLLILDRSSSMGDGPGSTLSAARRAAENFVRRCPDWVRVGVIAFDGSPSVLSSFSSDDAAVIRELHAIGAGGSTAIDAALAAGVDLITAHSEPGRKRTVILLSDGASEVRPALAQAERLREHARIVTIGFGGSANTHLLTAIAGPNGRFFRVSDPKELPELFALLASFVSTDTVAGVVEEPVNAPAPLQLAHTGEFHPIAVRATPAATIAWSVPVMDPGPVSLSYTVVPECPGWHAVARSGGHAVWRLADGSERTTHAPDGPRILVLPSLLLWSWPVLNPLFWMLFGRFFCRGRSAVKADTPVERPAPLVVPSIPAPLQPPQPALYQPSVRPALIVGLGEVGHWAVTHLAHVLADRGVASGMELIAVGGGLDRGRTPVRVGGFALPDGAKIDLRQDLRPYLEQLRNHEVPVRRWIPVVEWLGRVGPCSTDWVRDRREARLALLQRPDELETRVAATVKEMKTRGVDETALVIGSAADPECSGMLAEVAHMLSVAGAQTTALVWRPRVPGGANGGDLDALAHELERMILMRGDDVLSDRHQPAVAARRLLDRFLVLRDDASTADEAGRGLADAVWLLLAYAEVLRRVPAAQPDASGQHVDCSAIEQTSVHLPVESLWQWVRGRALARAVNGVWLGMGASDGLRMQEPPSATVSKWVAAFWSPADLARPQSFLLRSAAGMIGDDQGGSALALRGRLPSGALYEEQAAFADRERQIAAYFLEAWSQALLDESYAQRRCGLALLLAALREIEGGLTAIQTQLARPAAEGRYGAADRLASSLFIDVASYVERYRRDVETVIAALAGNQPLIGVVTAERESLAARVARMRHDAEADVVFPALSVRNEAEKREEAWYQRYGAALLNQLRFRFALDGTAPRLVLELAGKQVGSDLLADLTGFLAPYRAEVISWPLADVLDEASVGQPGRRFRIGASSAHLYPDVATVADDADPALAATMLVELATV